MKESIGWWIPAGDNLRRARAILSDGAFQLALRVCCCTSLPGSPVTDLVLLVQKSNQQMRAGEKEKDDVDYQPRFTFNRRQDDATLRRVIFCPTIGVHLTPYFLTGP